MENRGKRLRGNYQNAGKILGPLCYYQPSSCFFSKIFAHVIVFSAGSASSAGLQNHHRSLSCPLGPPGNDEKVRFLRDFASSREKLFEAETGHRQGIKSSRRKVIERKRPKVKKRVSQFGRLRRNSKRRPQRGPRTPRKQLISCYRFFCALSMPCP